MKMSFRWFGSDNDTIPIEYIKQIPRVNQVVWSLHQKVAGDEWTEEEIAKEVAYIKHHGYEIDVVESVNIHDDIKLGLPTRDFYIECYKKTLINLAKHGVKVVCYNFMPIFDWARTELFRPSEDGSTSMYFEKSKILSMSPEKLVEFFSNNKQGGTLPGWEPERLKNIQLLFEKYKGLTEEKLYANFKYFIDAIIPTCEKYDIKMAIHPDDPPFEIYGLPRLVNNVQNIRKILAANSSYYNGLTFCTGSLGSVKDNDLVELLEEFIDRVHFMHIRNVLLDSKGNFSEVSHLDEDGSVPIIQIMKVLMEHDYQGYIRPDHGRHIFGENETNVRPGYGLYDRAMGIMYLNGIIDGLRG
ncbi:mannonate dehydratase [Streptococcus sp. S784/96/1]|uniref:mannonate dehydratase n=1 Tax=Streptococcus sp. S784/96/1 TaxID=2653499 RepID=UPI0013869D54|nr:mannonate dehydratase [Streptococcus sp. S784/96/1]